MKVMRTLILAATVFSVCATAADKYTGPRPPKADLPYLLHADNLVETEVGMAKQETRKDTQVATLAGASSAAKTPLSEPIFLLKTQKLSADKIEAYKMDVKNGTREVVVSQKKGKNIAKPIHLVVTRLDEGLYKIEVDQPLENGEYTLSPSGSDDTFSFQVY